MKVFIHTNDKQKVGAKVSQYSFIKHNPDLKVELIELKDYSILTKQHGESYIRSGQMYVWDNADLQSFTPLRFAAAEQAKYEGTALVVDPDVFCLQPLGKLGEYVSNDRPVACRYIVDQKHSYWASSVMLLKCDELRSWKFNDLIQKLFSKELDYRDLMSLAWVPEEMIQNLESVYNSFDTVNSDTVLLHNTSRATQPWKTGLQIDYLYDTKLKVSKTRRLLGRIKRSVYNKKQYYSSHPDQKQVEIFLDNLKGAIQAGYITNSELQTAIVQKHIRSDIMELLK